MHVRSISICYHAEASCSTSVCIGAFTIGATIRSCSFDLWMRMVMANKQLAFQFARGQTGTITGLATSGVGRGGSGAAACARVLTSSLCEHMAGNTSCDHMLSCNDSWQQATHIHLTRTASDKRPGRESCKSSRNAATTRLRILSSMTIIDDYDASPQKLATTSGTTPPPSSSAQK